MFSTGPLVAIQPFAPARLAAPFAQVTGLVTAAVLPVPELSVTVVPDVWSSIHQPTGCPEESPCRVRVRARPAVS